MEKMKSAKHTDTSTIMCTPGTDTFFRFPALRTPAIYNELAAEALEAMCTPRDLARPGDLLALRIDLKFNDGTSSYPIIEVVVMGDAGAEVVTFPKAPPSIRERLSKHIIDFQTYGLSNDFIGNIGPIFDKGDGEPVYLTATVLPGAALVHFTCIEEDVFNDIYYDMDICQDAIDIAVVVIMEDWKTSHVLMQRIPALNNALNVFREATPIIGRRNNGATRHRFILGAPDLQNVDHMQAD